MKIKRILSLLMVPLFIFVMCAHSVADTQNYYSVTAVDTLSFDGSSLKAVYGVYSNCDSTQHTGIIELEPVTETYRNSYKVVSLEVAITDVSPSACYGGGNYITVQVNANLKTMVDQSKQNLVRDGYLIDPEFTIVLPEIYPSSMTPVFGEVTLPEAPSGIDPYTDNNDTYPLGGGYPDVPETVNVEVIDYDIQWTCLLDKHSNARRNEFEGVGSSEQQARDDAAAKCAVTNAVNPDCSYMSDHPDYTTCEVDIVENRSLQQYNSNDLPEDTQLTGWNCELWKNDGSRNDGFYAEAASLDEARREAGNMCGRTNHPDCMTYAYDPNHTTCLPQLQYQKPMPVTRWKCVLNKHSQARRNIFEGYGATREEARGQAESYCAVTNPVNPNCYEMSLDPHYTTCTPDIED